ncbi:MAG: FtsX-like permease family protein [Thermoanaerobaculia bacterium]
MIRHLVKLVWNRKRANGLLILEVFFSFLVVLAVTTTGLHLLRAAGQPLGYEWRNAWSVAVDSGQQGGGWGLEGLMETERALLREARNLAPVVAAAAISVPPYELGTDTGPVRPRGAPVEASVHSQVTRATDGLLEALELELVAGRWFEGPDSARAWEPVVIDRDLARAVFGAEDPLGRAVEGFAGETEKRVVGVLRDFRKGGELAPREPYLFRRIDADDPEALPARFLLVRVRPGTPVAFEEELVERLQAVAPELTFEVRTLAEARRTALRLRLIPLAAGALVAAFLLLMVALGLVGVLWQNVVQRTRELGLRRATGAARRDVHRQISMELLLVTTLGLALGILLAIQLPILRLVPSLAPQTFAAGVALAAAVLYTMALAAAAYPAWLAGRVQPAEALRWE